MSGGRHYDKGKLRLDLITPEMAVAQAAVLTYGAEKYGDNNWEQGMDWNKLFGSALRHLWKWWAGEDLDSESGLPHLWHAYCNVGFLLTYRERKAGRDNRDGRCTYPWSDPVGISAAVERALESVLQDEQSTNFGTEVAVPTLRDAWAEGHADDALEREAQERKNI